MSKLEKELESVEELGVCCYCGFSWILRYYPHNCPHCHNPTFKIKFPDDSVYNPDGSWSHW